MDGCTVCFLETQKILYQRRLQPLQHSVVQLQKHLCAGQLIGRLQGLGMLVCGLCVRGVYMACVSFHLLSCP